MSSSIGFFLIYLLSLVLTHAQLSPYRLPTTIKPINYKLELHPIISSSIINGNADIQINVTASYFEDNIDGNFDVSFHYYPTMVISTTVLQIDDSSDTQTVQLMNELQLNETTQIATATFNITKSFLKQLLDSSTTTVTISMQYIASIRGGDDLAGLYKSQYVYNDTTVINLVTQFQATDARSVFPCFDEPAFKATFDLTLIASVNALTLSNMPISETHDAEALQCAWISPEGEDSDECQIVRFETTPIMSTYLVAIVIGGYRSVSTDDDDDENVAQSVYYPYTFDEDRAQFALEESVYVLDEFSDDNGFDIPFTQSGIHKLDSVAVSDFAAGAMENWGLVVYRTVRLLIDREESSQSAKSKQILIIAHELAHQWFGNLVSPYWWDDLWLNEGFATYMAHYGGHLVQPAYNLNEEKIVAIKAVMFADASVFTHSVKQNITGDPAQIKSQFSSITYDKGMAVINTIANVMGNTEFLGGISTYLEEYQFSTATSEQLGAVLDSVQPQISELMDSFITQEGFPLIYVDTTLNAKSVVFRVKQLRFVKEGPLFYEANAWSSIPFVTQEMVTEFSAQLWKVPMSWRDVKGQKMSINGTVNDIMSVRELSTAHARVRQATSGPGESVEYYLVNPIDGASSHSLVPAEGLFNFYRVFYDDASFKLLTDNWLYIGSANQFAVISDRFALMAAGYITSESYLDFVQVVVNKMLGAMIKGFHIPDYPIYNEIIQSFVLIDDIFCELVFEDNTRDDIALRGYFRTFAVNMLRRVLHFVVDDISQPFSDDHEECPLDSDCRILQSVLLKALVRLEDRAVIEEAYSIYYKCENRICENVRLCSKCTGPLVEDERITFVSEDVLPALLAGVLSFDTTKNKDLREMIALYDMVNIEQQTYILNALEAVYPSSELVTEALDFIMSDSVRSNMKISALVALKTCTARDTLWTNITTADDSGETVFDTLFASAALFSQEPLTALANGFASAQKYESISAFFNAKAERTNAGTERVMMQTLENVYERYLWKTATQPGLEVYMRAYIVDQGRDRMSIAQIIIVTLVCCAVLFCLVFAFWAVSKPSKKDLIYMSMSKKRERRVRRLSASQSMKGAHAHHGSLGHSMDKHSDGLNIKDVVEEIPHSDGYGSTTDYNYNQLKQSENKIV